MRSHNHRILHEYHISPTQWAILFSASYYLSAPPEQFISIAQLESEENFSEDELTIALNDCLSSGWIRLVDPEEVDLMGLDDGIVLTDEGSRVKDQVSHALTETVEID